MGEKDLISRQAAIEDINKYILSFDAIDVNFLDGLKTAIKLIEKELPSAQRKGKWIHGDKMPDYPRVPYKPWMRYCSECKSMTAQDDNALFSYCPECGAKMKKE